MDWRNILRDSTVTHDPVDSTVLVSEALSLLRGYHPSLIWIQGSYFLPMQLCQVTELLYASPLNGVNNWTTLQSYDDSQIE